MSEAASWWRRTAAQAALAVLLATGVAVWLGWPALTQADRFHENWRQSPHWISPERQHFQADDLILRYSEFNTSPFANALYPTLARTGHDIVWGKVFTIVVFALAALTCFLAAGAMAGTPAGWAAVAVFLFFPSVYEHFVGGYMACFSWPLLALAVLLIYRRLWWWSVPLVGLSALVYPMVALHIGMMFLIDTLYHDVWLGRLRDRSVWRRKILPLALAALAVVAVIAVKYFDEHGFGELVTRTEMEDHVDFTSKGRYRILPTIALWTRLERAWQDPFHIGLLLVAVFFLGRNAFRLPRGLYTLLAASILMYWLADLLVMRLYLPSRYLRRSLPLFACLAAGVWWARIYYDAWRAPPAGETPARRRQVALLPLAVVTIALAVLGWREFGDELEPGEHTRVFDKHDLYAAIEELPGRPMIAAWPRLASELPVITGRTVLVDREHAHPWWTDYWDEVRERTQDYWQAYFTRDEGELRRIVGKYGIDYWIVEPRYFSHAYTRRRTIHYEPLDSWFHRMRRAQAMRRGPSPLLAKVPVRYRRFDNGAYFIVSSDDVFRWLAER